MNLVIWHTFVWLFGALSFGYLAQIPTTTPGRLSLARRTLLSFWRLWGIVMSLWSFMINPTFDIRPCEVYWFYNYRC